MKLTGTCWDIFWTSSIRVEVLRTWWHRREKFIAIRKTNCSWNGEWEV